MLKYEELIEKRSAYFYLRMLFTKSYHGWHDVIVREKAEERHFLLSTCLHDWRERATEAGYFRQRFETGRRLWEKKMLMSVFYRIKASARVTTEKYELAKERVEALRLEREERELELDGTPIHPHYSNKEFGRLNSHWAMWFKEVARRKKIKAGFHVLRLKHLSKVLNPIFDAWCPIALSDDRCRDLTRRRHVRVKVVMHEQRAKSRPPAKIIARGNSIGPPKRMRSVGTPRKPAAVRS